jgi:peptidyl-prolyl cis-trans isomerase C
MNKILPLLFVLLLLTACHTVDKGNVIAQVNNETLSQQDLESLFGKAVWDGMSIDQKRDYVHNWIDLTLLAQSAKEMNLNETKQVGEQIILADKKVLGNAVITEKLKTVQVSEEELFNYFRVHMGEFSQVGKILKVQRIFLSDRGKVDNVMQELRKGMNFADAAKAYSQEPIGQNGGYAGVVSVSDSVNTFWNALQNLKLFEIAIIPANGGYYLARYYEEELGSGTPTFDSLREEIRQRVLKEKRQQIYDDLLRDLKSQADITISI